MPFGGVSSEVITNSRAVILSAMVVITIVPWVMKALYSVAALLISALVVQTLYATIIRPRAEAILALPAPKEGAPASAGPTRNLRSPFVILKDYEQETALILACWALALIGYQARAVTLNLRLLSKQYVDVGE